MTNAAAYGSVVDRALHWFHLIAQQDLLLNLLNALNVATYYYYTCKPHIGLINKLLKHFYGPILGGWCRCTN